MDIFKYNTVLTVAIASWATAQIIKIIIELIRVKKLDLSLIMSSGGMPSSHSSFVTSCAMALGFENGFNSDLFALGAVLSMVVMYDASGVRRQAGKHAEILNIMVKMIEHPNLERKEDLKVLLGHTPLQVFAGAVLGIIVSVVAYM